ncbi:hypothetical protein WKV44_09930 [Spirochaetia bacterium 38H-sp]|uniref:Uncharacterized protein n=1 Tax=Rarispira pelagica TaxID=3141764 RepID=A0ABU9UDW4_9SPIR
MNDDKIYKKLKTFANIQFSSDFTQKLMEKIENIDLQTNNFKEKTFELWEYITTMAKPVIMAASLGIILSFSSLIFLNTVEKSDTAEQIAGILVENTISEVLK